VECPEMYGELKKALVKFDSTGPVSVLLSFYLPPGASPFQSTPVEIRVGETTAQDLIADIGSPLRVHYKEDDRMKIHKASSSADSDHDAQSDESEGYFYNYFQYGVDFLLSGKTHIVQKIILHSNVPGTYLFQRYKRCPWEIEVPSNRESTTDSPMPSHSSLPPVLEVPEFNNKGTKKGKKKTSSKGASPEPNLIDFDQGGDSHSEETPHETSVRTVSLFDKIDTIKAALSSSPTPSTASFHTSPTAAIPIRGASSLASRTAMSMRQMSQLSLSTSPPTMLFDRSSDSVNVETASLVESTSQLMGFDGMVLEVSELGDVLSVMIF